MVMGKPTGETKDSKPCGKTSPMLLLIVFLFACAAQGYAEEPSFVEPITNITAPAGRDVKLACSVKNLGTHKVAWIHYERSAILTVQNHVITRNPRISVSHDRHTTWFLQIHNLQESDRGRYMCQINTPRAKTQFGHLHVVVPPYIDDSKSSSDVIVKEQDNVTLVCKAVGSPKPTVKWRREDGGKIQISKSLSVMEYEGEKLHMKRVSRLDMGAYLCIASNGVPPTVSKRIKVSVDFSPMIWIPHQLVGAPLGYNVTLECFSEAHPTSLNYWTKPEGDMLHDSSKYRLEDKQDKPHYKTHMKLTIFNLEPKDYTTYKCVAKNPRGETDGAIKLYNSPAPSTAVVTTTTEETISKKIQDQTWESHHNSSTFRNPSSLAVSLTGKDSPYQSNTNTLEKTEKESTETSGKTIHYDWPKDDDSSSASGSSFVPYMSGLFIVLLGITAAC